MNINIPTPILNLKGQCVKQINYNENDHILTLHCRRDKRFKAMNPVNKQACTVNNYVQRTINDLPLLGTRFQIEIELAQVLTKDKKRVIEHCDLVDKGCYYTKRFCQLISGLCRYIPINALSKHFNIRWETIKNIDKRYLEATLPALNPKELTNLTYLGVDEVARAKGHDYMTVVYDLVTGNLIWVHEGRTAEIFSMFLKQLPETTKEGVLAVAMDMGPAYQKAVKDDLPNADIVFDRFHVMQNYSKAIMNQCRIEFRKADNKGKEMIKGSKFLLLRNKENLSDNQKEKLNTLLNANKNLNTIYIMKEQLQALWLHKNYEDMAEALENWCSLAEQCDMIYIEKFSKSLRKHKQGICNYAKHSFTTARIEAGNVSIGMIRKRARGIRDTEYFKLKIRQTSIPDVDSIFYKNVA